MSYYILPKKNNGVKLCPTITTSTAELQPIISFSLSYHLSEINKQITNIINNNDPDRMNYTVDFISKIVNPYEFIFSKVPSSKYSVSKLKPTSNLFYVFMEIVQTFNLFDHFFNKNIKHAHFGPHAQATIECIDMLREGNEDISILSEFKSSHIFGFEPLDGVDNMTIDMLYFELENDIYTNTSKYIIGVITILCNILSYQSADGVCIIKVDTIIHKPILDILFLLTDMYEKVYIIKPYASNMNKNERYIICKKFVLDYSKILENNICLKNLKDILNVCCSRDFLHNNNNNNNNNNNVISSLIKSELPYYFLNKIEELNVIIGRQQLDQQILLINIVKNRNRDEKIETIKKK